MMKNKTLGSLSDSVLRNPTIKLILDYKMKLKNILFEIQLFDVTCISI